MAAPATLVSDVRECRLMALSLAARLVQQGRGAAGWRLCLHGSLHAHAAPAQAPSLRFSAKGHTAAKVQRKRAHCFTSARRAGPSPGLVAGAATAPPTAMCSGREQHPQPCVLGSAGRAIVHTSQPTSLTTSTSSGLPAHLALAELANPPGGRNIAPHAGPAVAAAVPLCMLWRASKPAPRVKTSTACSPPPGQRTSPFVCCRPCALRCVCCCRQLLSV
jgi:hypothetical protein